ncbi:hypothetical protein C8J56DRAFT_112021 [Mycena floridula]|nr:hypothetical protein C8J56DRAFT_112021 [Mycena floridula]
MRSTERVLSLTTMSLNMFPPELIAYIIDQLSDDFPSLLVCSVVCKSWRDRARYHIFSRGVVKIHEKGSRKRGLLKFLQVLEDSNIGFSPGVLEIHFDKEPRQLMSASTLQRLTTYSGQGFAYLTKLCLDRVSIPEKAEDARPILAQLAVVLGTVNNVINLSIHCLIRNHATPLYRQILKGKKSPNSSEVDMKHLMPKLKRLLLSGEGSSHIASFLSSIDAVAQVEKLAIVYRGVNSMRSLLDTVGRSLVELRISGITASTSMFLSIFMTSSHW